MLPDYAHSLGGKKTALKNRKNALDNYYKNPKYCQNCGKIIEVKDGQKISEVRVKKFCDHKCASTFNNSKRKITNITITIFYPFSCVTTVWTRAEFA